MDEERAGTVESCGGLGMCMVEAEGRRVKRSGLHSERQVGLEGPWKPHVTAET